MDISDLSTRQIANALVIFAAALPFGGDAAKAALMTAAAESSFKRFANNGESTRPEVWVAYGGRQNFRDVIRQSLTFPHDAEAGADWTTADSLGLFQQRPMYDYGEIRDLMDPAESTRIFVRGSRGGSTRFFLESPKTMSLAQRCQWTQGSEFPTGENYVPMETVADQLIAHFGGLPKPKDWFMANNWDEAKAELDASLDARFNGLREFIVEQVKGQVSNTFWSLKGDLNELTAAVRGGYSKDDPINNNLDAIWHKVDDLQRAVAELTTNQV